MRIDQSASAQHSALPFEKPIDSSQETTGFREVLQRFFTEPPPPTLQFASLQLEIHSSALAVRGFNRKEQQLEQADLRLELQEDFEEVLELREDEFLEDLAENQEDMEELVDDWEEAGRRLGEGKGVEVEKAESQSEAVEVENDGDEGVEEEQELQDYEEDQPDKEQTPEFIEAAKRIKRSVAADELEAREINYEEIQILVRGALESSSEQLTSGVQTVLRQLLESLLDGKRHLLDQHRLMGLERDEFYHLMQMFPPRFYGGLLRSFALASHKPPLYTMLQNVFMQHPPEEQHLKHWEYLLESKVGELPVSLKNWLYRQPLLAQPEALRHSLDILRQRNAFFPGAVGRCLELASVYAHHTPTLVGLFEIAQLLFYGEPLGDPERELLAQKICERCFPRELGDHAAMQARLQLILKGEALDESETLAVLSGCQQSVLSYLPYAYVHPDLQAMQDYVQRDLGGREERVQELLQEEGA